MDFNRCPGHRVGCKSFPIILVLSFLDCYVPAPGTMEQDMFPRASCSVMEERAWTSVKFLDVSTILRYHPFPTIFPLSVPALHLILLPTRAASLHDSG